MRNLSILCCYILGMFHSGFVFAQTETVQPETTQTVQTLPSVDEVMNHLDDLYRSTSSHAVMRMSVVTSNFERELELESWTEGEDQALTVIRSPSREAGTATLRTEDGLWNYAPRADRLMRVPTALMSEGWMGSHFTNDDMMRESDYSDDYDTTMELAQRDGEEVLIATLIPHEDAPVVYSKVEMWLVPDTWMPLRSDYYDGEELLRTMTFTSPRTFGDRTIPAVLTITPHTDPGEHTTFEYLEMEFNIDVNSSFFTQRGLRRMAGRR